MRTGQGNGWILAAVLLVVTAGLAGCLGGDEAGDGGQSPGTPPANETDGTGDAGGSEGSNATGDDTGRTQEEATVGPATEVPFYFTDQAGLAGEPPDNGSIAIPQQATDGTIAFETDAFPATFVVAETEVTLTLFVTTETPRPAGSGFDLVVWAGTTASTALGGGTSVAEGPMQPGEVREVELTLSSEATRGLLVPEGTGLEVLMTVRGSQGGGNLVLLTGGDTPSSVTVPLADLTEDPTKDLDRVAEDTITGTMPGNGPFVPCDVEEELTTNTHALNVTATHYLELSMSAPGGSGEEDLDLSLLDGDEVLATTISPDAEEGILLAGPTLEGLSGQELTVKVTACTAANTSYEIHVRQA